MKPPFGFVAGAMLLLFAPGCCIVDHVFCGGLCYGPGYCGGSSCGGASCGDDCKLSKKCAKKCRKCRKCLQEEGLDGAGHGGMMVGGMGLAGDCCGGGGCGCGGGAMMPEFGGMSVGGGDCGCSGGGSMPMPMRTEAAPYVTQPMMVPTPGQAPSPPPPTQSTTVMPPAIPPADSSSTQAVPQGTQQVSVEEFQRLPGVVISGPGSQPLPQIATTPARTIQPASVTTAVPASAKPIQQAGWVPTQK